MNDFLAGMAFVKKGFNLIRQPGLRRFALMPVLINVLVFSALGYFAWQYFNQWISGFSLLQRWQDVAVVAWLAGFIKVLFAGVLLVVMFFTFTVVANLIGAPFNSLLAERTQLYLSGRQPPSGQNVLAELVRSIPKTLGSEIRKLLYLLMWMVPLGILSLIPGLNLAAPFIWLAFGAWVFALEYIDYPMGNNGHGFASIKRSLQQRRMLSMGFGTAVALLNAVPLLNLLVMPTAVAGATALWLENLDNQASGAPAT